MALTLSSEELSVVLQALRAEEVRPHDRRPFEELVDRLTRDGWASIPDVEDVPYLADRRIDGLRYDLPVSRWCELFKYPLRTVYSRPRSRQASVVGGPAIETADLTDLLIEFERMGFSVDPGPLVKQIRPTLEGKAKLTDSELSIWWYEQRRHKNGPFEFQTTERPLKGGSDEFRTATGYGVLAYLGEEDRPWFVSIKAPRHRRRPTETDVTCAHCGWEWRRGDPDSSAAHRREHKRRMRYLDPQPLPAMRAELERGTADSTDVTSASPRWKHREIFRRAAAFRREFGYDFTQWQSPNGDDDPGAVGKLFCDGFGRIIAACSFRLREHEDEAWHALQWIWVAPPYRRAGVISAAWPSLRDRFGAFHVEGPVSEAMEAFLIKLGDEHLMDWNKVKRFRMRSAYPAD